MSFTPPIRLVIAIAFAGFCIVVALVTIVNYTTKPKSGTILPVPKRAQLIEDGAARKELLVLLEEFAKKGKAFYADRTEEISVEESKRFNHNRLNKLLEFISQHPNARSVLTAILTYANVVTSEGGVATKEDYGVILEALAQLRSEQPQSWQAQIAPFIESNAKSCAIAPGYWGDRELERVTVAYETLQNNLPKMEPSIDWNDPELLAFGTLFGKVKCPLRAKYQLSIARWEEKMASVVTNGALAWDLQTSGKKDELIQLRRGNAAHVLKWHEKASKSYEKVIQEHPNTWAAQEAASRTNAIETSSQYYRRGEHLPID